jgi:glycosyltransferase involved in cell wall biosynthesis
VAVRAATRLGVHLKVVGTGPDLDRLRSQADSHTTFLGAVDAATLRDLYRQTTALVLPAEEDFGIAPVEAMACGRPVVALGRGGATETVVPGRTGQLVDTQSAEAFADAMRVVQRTPYDAHDLARHAAHFSLEQFELGLRRLLTGALADTSPC